MWNGIFKPPPYSLTLGRENVAHETDVQNVKELSCPHLLSTCLTVNKYSEAFLKFPPKMLRQVFVTLGKDIGFLPGTR